MYTIKGQHGRHKGYYNKSIKMKQTSMTNQHVALDMAMCSAGNVDSDKDLYWTAHLLHDYSKHSFLAQYSCNQSTSIISTSSQSLRAVN